MNFNSQIKAKRVRENMSTLKRISMHMLLAYRIGIYKNLESQLIRIQLVNRRYGGLYRILIAT